MHTCHDQIEPQNGESKIRLHHAQRGNVRKDSYTPFQIFNSLRPKKSVIYIDEMLLKSCTQSKKIINKRLKSFHLHLLKNTGLYNFIF
jgi:hypothetical protein